MENSKRIGKTKKTLKLSDAEYNQLDNELDRASDLNFKNKRKAARKIQIDLEKKVSERLKIYPQDDDLWGLYAMILSRLDRHQQSLRANKKAIQLNPDRWPAYYNAGLDYVKLKQWKSAIACFTKILQLHGVPREQRSRCYSWNAELYLKSREYKKTVEMLEREWQLKAKKRPGDLLKIARLYNLIGKMDKCKKVLQQYLKVADHYERWELSEYPVLKNLVMNTFFPRKDFNGLNSSEQRLVAHVELFLDQIHRQKENKLSDKALAKAEKYNIKLEKAIQENPTSACLCFQHGRVLGRLKQYDAAMVSYQKAHQLDTEYWMADYYCTALNSFRKKWKETLLFFDKVIKNPAVKNETKRIMYIRKIFTCINMKDNKAAYRVCVAGLKVIPDSFFTYMMNELKPKITGQK